MQTLSRLLVKKLRHDVSIDRDPEGYVQLSLLTNAPIETVKELVAKDEKGRLSLRQDKKNWYIRANQGHSKNVGAQIDDTKFLTLLTDSIHGVFHGTYIEHIESIKKTGLNRMARKHIHLAKTMDSKSGKRNNCTSIVYVNMKNAMEDGILFYESENGVILTEGKDGVLLPKYLTAFDLR